MSSEPKTPDERDSKPTKHQRDRYDYHILGLTAVAAIVAFFSGVFTYEQACTSRDTEYRSLRPYLVVTVKATKPFVDGERPFITFLATAKGQTPVYNFRFFYQVDVPDENAEPDQSKFSDTDCGLLRQSSDSAGTTFSDSDERQRGISDQALARWPDFFSGKNRLTASGTACYEDAFAEVHAFRFCYEWRYGSSYPDQCDYDTKLGERFDPPKDCDVFVEFATGVARLARSAWARMQS